MVNAPTITFNAIRRRLRKRAERGLIWLKELCDNVRQGFLWNKCDVCGMEMAKPLFCGKEVCNVCGKTHSQAHKRRFDRWWYKCLFLFEKYGKMRYIVITLPTELCLELSVLPPWERRKLLKDFRRYVKRKLDRLFGKKEWVGKMRYHWAGDKGYFHPHLNIIIAGRWVEKPDLKKLRVDCARWWKNKGFAVPKEFVIHTQYIKTIPLLRHKVKYITRPTMNLIDDTKFEKEFNSYLERMSQSLQFLEGKILTIWEKVGVFLLVLLRDLYKEQFRLLFDKWFWWYDVVDGFRNDIEFGWTREIQAQYKVWLYKREEMLDTLIEQEYSILDNLQDVEGLEDLSCFEIRRLETELRRIRLMLGLCPFCGAKLGKWEYWQGNVEILEAQGWFFDEDLGILYKDTS